MPLAYECVCRGGSDGISRGESTPGKIGDSVQVSLPDWDQILCQQVVSGAQA